jgi:hypothetical protein
MNMPFNYYAPSYPTWSGYPQYPMAPPPQLALNPAPPAPNPALPAPNRSVKSSDYPKIPAWLTYCDNHPERCGEDFSLYAWKFEREGWRRIHQLTGDRISVEKLSDWLSIGKGTADLLIRYAEEDVDHIKAGTFTMTLADDLAMETVQN